MVRGADGVVGKSLVMSGPGFGMAGAMGRRMTTPRQVLENATYLVSRRCTQQQFLLRPCKEVNEVFGYVLALAAQRHGVQVHAYCVLSNHYHLVVTDPRARLPAFQQLLNGLVARAINALHGRWEHFWAPDSYSAVVLETKEDILAKAAYVLANPVAAHLVRRGREWPGLWSGPEAAGQLVEMRRPEHFFSRRGNLPESIGLKLEPPPGFGSAAAYRSELAAALATLETEQARAGTGVLGAQRVLRQRPTDQPPAPAPRRGLNPRVAGRDKWKRIELLHRLKAFLGDYREALEAWREKRRGVRFPAGTYLMRVVHGVRCAVPG